MGVQHAEKSPVIFFWLTLSGGFWLAANYNARMKSCWPAAIILVLKWLTCQLAFTPKRWWTGHDPASTNKTYHQWSNMKMVDLWRPSQVAPIIVFHAAVRAVGYRATRRECLPNVQHPSRLSSCFGCLCSVACLGLSAARGEYDDTARVIPGRRAIIHRGSTFCVTIVWLTGVPQLRNYPISTIVSSASHINHCLYRCYPISTIVSLVSHINHRIVGIPYQPLYRRYPIWTILSSVSHINHLIVGIPYQPSYCIPYQLLYRVPYQPLHRWHPISTILSLVSYINRCWYPMSTIISLASRTNYCVVGIPYQPLYRWHLISTIVSLVSRINHCIVVIPCQPFYCWYEYPMYNLCTITMFGLITRPWARGGAIFLKSIFRVEPRSPVSGTN